MGSVPLVALQGRGASDGGEQGIRNALGVQAFQQQAALAPGQEQLQQQQIQQQQQALNDQKAVTTAMQQWDGKDLNELPSLILKNHGSAMAVFGTKKQILEQQEAVSKADDATLTSMAKKNSLQLGKLDSLDAVPDEQLGSAIRAAAQEGVVNKYIDPQHAQGLLQLSQQDPAAIRAQLPILKKGLQAHETQFSEAITQRKTAAEEMQAQAAKTKAEADKQPTETSLAVAAVGGDANAEKALQRLDQSKRASRPVINNMSGSDAKDIADAIESGDQPPTLTGLYKNGGPVRAELARRGVPLAKMETDWKATQKYLSTLNGSQQVRLRQAISTASDSLDKIDGLYRQWKALAPQSGFKVINRATLTAMKNLPGQAGAIATALDAQIADFTGEMGNVIMGGNSPTDHSLTLAAKNLSSDWNDQTFTEGTKQARANIKIRQNSILHAMPAGVGSEYMPPAAPAAPAQPWEKYPVHQ